MRTSRRASDSSGRAVGVLVDDGRVRLRVLDTDGVRVRTEVVVGGLVVTAGAPPGIPGSTNNLRVHTVGTGHGEVLD